MTPFQLHRAVARATGDDVATIEALGFSLLTDDDPSEDDLPGQVIGWDDDLDLR